MTADIDESIPTPPTESNGHLVKTSSSDTQVDTRRISIIRPTSITWKRIDVSIPASNYTANKPIFKSIIKNGNLYLKI